VRSTLVDPEAGDTDTIGSFRIRRTKTKFEGWFYDKNLEFELQMNWPSADIVEDANLNWVIGRDRSFMLKAGSFKVPFGRQELTSSGSQQFVDRSLVSNEFARGRDLGIQLWGELMEKKIDWRVGVFNGAGFGRVSVNDNDKYEFVGRVQFHPNGDPKYSEVDFDSKDTPLFAIAGEFDVNDLRPGSNNSGVKRQHFGGDVVFKYKGLFAFGEAFFGKRTNVAEEDTDVRGFNLQAGYLVIASKLEIAGRYASLDLDTDADDNERTELGGAISYYYNKHNLKWQNDFRVLEDKAKDEGERKTFEFRSQLQFIF
jgi:phosphate-selective porin